MYAIVKCGGKQYKVEKDDIIVVDQLSDNAGDTITIDDVVMVRDDNVLVDNLDKVKVTASIVEHFRGDKLIVFKYKSKKNYRRKTGHRSYLTRIKIEDIKITKTRAAKKEEAPQEAEVTA